MSAITLNPFHFVTKHNTQDKICANGKKLGRRNSSDKSRHRFQTVVNENMHLQCLTFSFLPSTCRRRGKK